MKHNHRLFKLLSLAVILSTLILSCNVPFLQRETPTPEPTPLPPLAPQVIQMMPERGEEQQLDAPVQLVFDQAMDKASVEAAFTIRPVVSGNLEWVTDRVMRFKPAGAGFRRATRYTVTVGEDAKSAAAVPLRAPVELRFTTVGFLEVASVQPAPDTEEVALDATVTVMFNRPVVALTAIEDQSDLPQLLTFTPPVVGTGEWLNTSIYVFTPGEGFAPATTYTARVAAGLADTTGGVLADDYTWEFTTVMPAVVATYPGPDTMFVGPEPTIYVAFNQPMDRASAEAAFELKNQATGRVVAGAFEWHNAGLLLSTTEGKPVYYEPYQWSWSTGAGPERVGVETMGFAPDKPLDLGATYRATVAAGAKAAVGQAATSQDYGWAFSTIEYPRIVSTDPADGAAGVSPGGGLSVYFSSPMDSESINGNFVISPPVSETEVYTYWWDSNTSLNISFYSEPNTDYEVTISGRVKGRYGQELGQDSTVRWHNRAYDPFAYLLAPGYNIGVYSAYTDTIAYVTVLNVGRVNLALYRMPVEDFFQANGRDSWNYWDSYSGKADALVREWTLDVNLPLDQRGTYGTYLSEGGGPLAPGLYFLKVWGDESSIYPEALPLNYALGVGKEMLIVSRYNLTLKTASTDASESLDLIAWATDQRTGVGVADVPVVVLNEFHTLVEGVTDGDGVFAKTTRYPLEDWYTPVFAFTGDPDNPGDDFSAVINQWSQGISPWDFGLSSESYASPFTAYMFTDRPIYRPSQTVYFKGVLRTDDDARYSVQDPPGWTKMEPRTVSVTIWDPQGTKVFENTNLPVSSDLGTFDGEFTLGGEAALGNYSIQMDYRGSQFYASFLVAEYRKPEFQVEVQADKPEYVQGDEINVAAQATYFFGGPVANASVRYSVLSADTYFNYQGPGWWSFADWDYDAWWRTPSYGAYGELVTQGEGTTDAEGRFTFSVEADIAEKLLSQRYTLEVVVTDVNNQEVANRVEAIVHKGLYYIGLQPEEYVGTTGRESRVNLITVDWASEPSPNQELTVVFAQHNWYSVQKLAEDGNYYWESVVEDVPVFTATVTTDAGGKANAGFTPATGGVYKVTASGRDERGNQVRSAAYMWVSGADYVNWRQENNNRLELVADKRQYQVGDTATILVPHPYQGPVQALITIERGHIYQHWVQTLETNSEQIQIPITEDFIPNVFVSVIIIKGMDETNPLPNYRVGYVELPVETTEKQLTITLTPDRPADQHYQPGDTVTYNVDVADSGGNPVEAEVTLALIDKAVLTLAQRQGPDIVGHFWRERGLGVNTSLGLTLSGNRISEELGREVKGMGGGGGGEEFGPVRSRFPDLAYWKAALRTDRGGHAQVSVRLPDNLTTWRLSAWGITAETLVGQADVDIISTKDLLVQPAVPRFFVVGDQAELAAVIHNNTDERLLVEVKFEAGGLQIGESASVQASIAANDRVKVTWPVTVGDVETTTLRWGARAGSLRDAVEIALPVYRYSTPEVVATAGVLDADGQVVEAAALPPSFDSTQGELTVQVDPSLAAGMVDGLNYLEHYPYECTEQTVSRFLPNVVTYRALKDLGVERPDLEKALPGLVNEGLQRLYNQQHYDGGWGWWVEGESNPYLSAYVLLGLIEAQRADFAVDDGVIRRAVDYLRGSLSAPRDLQEHWQANRQAFILYVLAESGQGDLGRTTALFDRRETLDTFGEAYLAMALALLEPDKPARVNTLISDINNAAIVSATGAHWEEAQPDYYAMNTDTRSTAIVLAALSRLNPQNALAPNTVRWLMAVRENGYWETTQETAWSLIALTDWMSATGELQGAYNWHVVVNNAELGHGTVSSDNIDETTRLQVAVAQLLADQANRVIIERWAPAGQNAGAGRLYYALYLRYFKPVEEVTALNRGIIVSRQYCRVMTNEEMTNEQTGGCQAVSEAQVGDTIRVKLTIIAPNDLHYVVVEDPFPAGAEGVDTSLQTTSVVAESPELVRTDQVNPWWGGWGWWWFSHADLRDEKAVLFADYLPRGTYEYTYLIRASTPGEYRTIPTHAYEMYFPEVFGRSDGGVFTITE